MIGDAWSRRFFKHFLVSPLHGAVTVTQMDRIALAVGQYLNLDVAWILQEFFQIDNAAAEEGLGFGLGYINCLEKSRFAVHHPHSAPAATCRRLDDDGVADVLGNGESTLVVVINRAIRTWHRGYSGFAHHFDRGHLVAHQANGFGAWSDEDETTFLDLFGEIGVLGKETVAWVNCYRVGDFGSADDGRNVQVAVGSSGGADAHRLIGQTHMHQIAIGAGMHGHSLDTQLLAGPEYTKGDFAAVGNQNFIKHEEKPLLVTLETARSQRH